MNENQEKNKSLEPIEPKEPLAKKMARFSAIIYLALAITVVIVATVGIFSISYDYEESLPEVSFPELNFEPQENSIPQIVITPPVDDDPEAPVINEESGVDADVSLPEKEERVLFYRPVNGEISKGYSMESLVFSETMKDYRVHSGIDISAPLGTDVVSFSDGVVASVVNDYFNGTTVSVTHSDGAVSYYMNLDSELAENIAVGVEVLAGQKIGKVGNTARLESAQEPHLHFELRVNGSLVDPKTELPA